MHTLQSHKTIRCLDISYLLLLYLNLFNFTFNKHPFLSNEFYFAYAIGFTFVKQTVNPVLTIKSALTVFYNID